MEDSPVVEVVEVNSVLDRAVVVATGCSEDLGTGLVGVNVAGDGSIQEDQVWEALHTVFDPEIPVDLVNLGLVYRVAIDQTQGRVDIDMTLTAPGCGMGPVLVGDVEHRVALVPNVNTVAVNLVFDPPWHRDMMSEEAQLETGMFF